ncbi:uncharacterized protein LOC133745144 isoform X2 [Rosa rugosa]|uniref:uncharacterized protein LOC133745144 isoform X2 n=1 Tax=Rosa rugosa TaxID=74645 RepID=UPI002B40B631|nr:uncharacterized protein LOC133745144 isoform X2 [Rosa rugosa]
MDEWVPRTGVVIGEIPNYDIPDLFTVKIFHGGRIINNKYVGGRIDYFDNCDKDPDRPPKNWSRSHFNTHLKCDILVNNICESFNSFILPARGKPIISMFEEIRMKLMKRIQIRRDKMMKYEGNICPKPREILDKNKVKAATDCISRLSGGPLVEVESIGGGQYVVHLENRTCTCRLWDLSGIPCKHAISAIHHKRHKPEDYVDNCYRKSTYMQIYDNIILPINGMDLWEVSDQAQILPPQYNRQPGRPRTKRIKDASEKVENSSFKLGRVQRSLKCSNCHVLGHNIKSCHRHLPPKEKTSKKVSKKRKLNSGEASTSATQSQNVGPQKASVIRKNKLREKAKERAQKAKERRDEIKASGTKASSIASIKAARAVAKASKSSKPSQTSTTSKTATSSKVSTSVKAATPTRASARIRKVPKNVN